MSRSVAHHNGVVGVGGSNPLAGSLLSGGSQHARQPFHANLLKMRLISQVQEIMSGGLSQRVNDELTSLRRGRITEKTP